MFKLRPKTEMIWAGCGLAVLTLLLILAVVVGIPLYSGCARFAGKEVIFPAAGYAKLLEAYRALVFGVLPAIAILSGTAAWIVFKNLRRIRDDTAPVA